MTDPGSPFPPSDDAENLSIFRDSVSASQDQGGSAMFVWLLAMSLSAAGPQMDVATICRPAQTAALPEDKASSYDTCVREESEARRQIQQSWSQYSPGVRSDCTFPSGVSESYVELLTCLELESGKGFGTPANSPGAPLLNSAAAGRTR